MKMYEILQNGCVTQKEMIAPKKRAASQCEH